MKRLKIALDCDGLLSDFTRGALRVVEEVTGKRFVPADVTEWDFCKVLGLTFRETHLVKKTIGRRRGFVTSLLPYPLARQGVRRLRELGEVFCVTSPWDSNPWWREEREAWLALHFGIDVVYHAANKTVYEADVFVDDRSDHVRAWLGAWPGRTAVLWRTLHNTSEDVPCGAHSTDSWEALYQIGQEVALGRVSQQRSLLQEGSQQGTLSASAWDPWVKPLVSNVSARRDWSGAMKHEGFCSGTGCPACAHRVTGEPQGCENPRCGYMSDCADNRSAIAELKLQAIEGGTIDSSCYPDDVTLARLESSAGRRLKGSP